MEDKWIVVLWDYGYHHDEFDFIEARGPFDFETAEKVEMEYIDKHGYTDIVKIKGE